MPCSVKSSVNLCAALIVTSICTWSLSIFQKNVLCIQPAAESAQLPFCSCRRLEIMSIHGVMFQWISEDCSRLSSGSWVGWRIAMQINPCCNHPSWLGMSLNSTHMWEPGKWSDSCSLLFHRCPKFVALTPSEPPPIGSSNSNANPISSWVTDVPTGWRFGGGLVNQSVAWARVE